MDRSEGSRIELPEDGYQWRKYGQKFIKNIGKVRSYFKCQRANCNAKKKAEWSEAEPSDLRVVYEGVHNHGRGSSSLQDQPTSGSSSADANRYDLITQIFGDNPPPDPPHGQPSNN